MGCSPQGHTESDMAEQPSICAPKWRTLAFKYNFNFHFQVSVKWSLALTKQNMCQAKSWRFLSYPDGDSYETKCYCNTCLSWLRCDGLAGSVKTVITSIQWEGETLHQAARLSDFRNLYWTKLTALKKHTKFWLLSSEPACSYLSKVWWDHGCAESLLEKHTLVASSKSCKI